MVDALIAPPALQGSVADRPVEVPLSVGATLTLRAAERHAARTGAAAVAPSHLLVAILERPDPRVRAYLNERGASLTWLCDTAFAGVSQLGTLNGPPMEELIASARSEAAALGQARADDLSLLLALLRDGDELSARLAVEAGLTGAPAAGPVVREAASELNAIVAAPSPFAPHVGASTWRPAVRHSRWRRNLRALLGDIDLSPIFGLMLAVVVGSGIMLATAAGAEHQRALTVTFVVAVYLVSLCMHEFGHAAAAYLTGERGVKQQGYLTLDIRAYSNPLLTFGLPLLSLLAGYLPLPGGCVMLRPSYFRSVREERFISAAGPAANLLCLFILSIPLHLGMDQWTPLGTAIAAAASLQTGVFLFNLLPVPPLDGWNIVTAGSSHSLRAQAASLGFMPLLGLLMLFRASPEVGAAFWASVDGIGALFAVDWWPAEYGRWLLSFR
jgi:Zn-dependent protease